MPLYLRTANSYDGKGSHRIFIPYFQLLIQINHFIRFLNSRGIHTIVPLRNSRKIQPIRRNPEEQPLKISAASDLLEKYIVHMRTAGALSNTTHQCLRFFNNHCAANYPITSKLTEEMILSW